MQKNIDEIRAFNRFYTRIIGLLDKYILNSSYTLPEVRVLYELYNGESVTAGSIIQILDIDKGYLSRLLDQFEKKKLIAKKRSETDGRAAYISLTTKGRAEFEILNNASNEQVKNILDQLSANERKQLLFHMAEIKKILAKSAHEKN